MRRGIAIAILALLSVSCEPATTLTPPGETRIDCLGVPPQQCQSALDEARAASASALVELVVHCTAPPCTIQQGEVEVRARYADGIERVSGSGWGAAEPPVPVDVDPPPEALPVVPVCIGLAKISCHEMATSAMTGLPPDHPPVVSITVRCTAVCTPTKGEGDTVVQFADGTSTTTGWGYETVGGG